MSTNEAVIKSKVTADTANFEGGMNRAGQKAESFGKQMKGVGSAIKGAFAAAGLARFAQGVSSALSASRQLVEEMGSIADLSMEFGIPPEQVQGLKAFAEDAGQSADAMLGMIAKVREYQEALMGTDEEAGKAQLSLAGLGIAAERFSELAPGAAFVELTEALAKYEGDGARAATIFDILGSKGRRMQGLLTELGKQGGLDGITKKYADAGQILSAEDVAKVDAAGDAAAGRLRAAKVSQVMAGVTQEEIVGSTQATRLVAEQFREGDIPTGVARSSGLWSSKVLQFQKFGFGAGMSLGAKARVEMDDRFLPKPIADKIDTSNTLLQKIVDKPTGARF